jgi:hypothetical protein
MATVGADVVSLSMNLAPIILILCHVTGYFLSRSAVSSPRVSGDVRYCSTVRRPITTSAVATIPAVTGWPKRS